MKMPGGHVVREPNGQTADQRRDYEAASGEMGSDPCSFAVEQPVYAHVKSGGETKDLR